MSVFESFHQWWFMLIIGQISGRFEKSIFFQMLNDKQRSLLATRHLRFSLGIPYNLPKLCPNASWNASAVTITTITWIGAYPRALFVNTNNTLFAANRESGIVRVFLEGNTVPIRNLSGNISVPYSLFVSDVNDIYVDNGEVNLRVDKWSPGATSAVSAMYVCGGCYGLFIDISNNLYCSMNARHQVLSKSLDDRLNIWSVVAGTGTAGSTSLTLYNPRGITVDKNLYLYVADCSNHRIQRFPYQQLNGTTVVGASAPGTISLYCPIAIVLDADGYLFISDNHNHRIVGSSSSGYRCIASCSGAGSSASALFYPAGLSFDSYGNIYIVDNDNHRIQKFLLSRNSCGKNIASDKAEVESVKPINVYFCFRYDYNR